MDMSNILNNKAVSKEFSIYNGTGHNKQESNDLFSIADVDLNRLYQYVLRPGAKPKWNKKHDLPLNAIQLVKEFPPAIDSAGLLMQQEDFYVPNIELPPLIGSPLHMYDLIMASQRYVWACFHSWKFIPVFYLDRLYIPQKVYDHDPDPKREQEFSTKAKIVGCILRAASAPYAPLMYKNGIEQGQDVSAASLKSCILYYNQPKVFAEEKKHDMNLLGTLDFLQKWLDYKVAMNQNLPDYMFPTPIAPTPFDPGTRPVVTFSA